ncbi:coiled-coil domain-containing protein 57 [Lingula anatina]|uniref:Coiled-coil domain-containing protein 57 n=1 Tax=Lingula anatina TaxID=7574 RepID=A0A1S3KEF0_LINAN|nr:coiled-coil domain-containing protein 57 [Lingula anatina]|eukprot:XP_013420877.1 coiled-coil domain-containing protein 57 [Lingula anatina]
MSQPPPPDSESLRELAAQKEKEWRELQELRNHTLEIAYKEKENQLNQENAKFMKLKEDFKYNLKLLEERDVELERYDAIFGELKAAINAKNGEISEMKIQQDELCASLKREEQAKEQLQMHYQQRMREKQTEVDQFRSEKEAEIKAEREQLENIKRNLEHQLREVEGELDVQKREITAGFDEAMKRREHEFRTQMDEKSGQILAYELKIKLLTKEVEMLSEAGEKTEKEFHHVDQNHRTLEKKFKEKEWEFNDMQAMKDARIQELESKLHQTELGVKRMEEEFQRKFEERDRYAREKESALLKVKEGHHETERVLQENIRELQTQLEQAQVESRRLQWENQDLAKEKELQAEKLHGEIHDVKEKWDAQLSEIARTNVARDLELQALKDNEDSIKAELQQKKESIERYKKEMTLAVEREASLERAKAQLDLDWQRRYEEVERLQYERSEDLVKNLTRARDEAFATLKEKDRELQQRESLIRVLTRDRDQALATLKQHGLVLDRNIDTSAVHGTPTQSESEEISQLQAQNEKLRTVIRQMRTEMENIGDQEPVKQKPGNSVTEEYVRMLEDEVRSLKSKMRNAESDLQTKQQPREDPPLAQAQDLLMKSIGDNALVRSHIQSLNDTIASLRREKVELSAQVKKQQARLQFQEASQNKLSKQPREKQLEIDQLQYELGAQGRRHVAEVASLRQKIAELELQLIETRKEADEYFKANLEKNLELNSLQNELSSLKVDLAQKTPGINYGGQELMIQQLEDEIKRLQNKLAGRPDPMIPDQPIRGPAEGATVDQLRSKLKQAAKHITQLAKEKQQLIEVGNRQRAILMNHGIRLPTPPRLPPKVMPLPAPAKPVATGRISQAVQNKLTELEQLQYQLTKQELAQQRRAPAGDEAMTAMLLEPSSSESQEEEYRPQSILKRQQSDVEQNYQYGYPVRPVSAPGTWDPVPVPDSRPSTAPGQPGQNGLQRTSSPFVPLATGSSLGGESLQEVWRMLDEGQSPSLFTPRDSNVGIGSDQLSHNGQVWPQNDQYDPHQRTSDHGQGGPLNQWSVQGTKPSFVDHKGKPDKKLSDKAAGKLMPKKSQKPKIRNYSKKDGES